MYFQDAFVLETHLNNDWTILLKNLKQREDSHFQLLQYNKKIIHQQKQEDIQVFMHDKIQQHKREFSKINQLCAQMDKEETEILQKYEANVTVFEQIVKLTERVGARILQICQYSLDKCKSLDQQLVNVHNKMKVALVKQISQKTKVNLEEVIKIVINYAKSKLNNEVQKLKKLITGLENGEFDKLQQIYFPRARKISLKLQKPAQSVQKAKVLSVGREDKSPPMRQEIKKLQKIKIQKQKQKLATKMVYGLYSTMQLSKAQFIEDMCGNEKQKVTRLYNQIFSRNKFNYEQIIAFQAKKELFQEKVKIFKQMMEKESKKITQVLIRKPVRQKKTQEMSKSLILKTNQNQSQQEQPEQFDEIQKKNSSVNRYRISSPRGKKEIKDGPLCFTNMLQSTQQNFNHFKFDASGQQTYLRTNRNRLPQLPNFNSNYRASSFQQRLQNTKNKLINQKQKYEKQQSNANLDSNLIKNQRPRDMKHNQEKINSQRVKMILKNCEVGVQGVMRKVQSIGKQKKKVEPNPMQYTFYVRKSGNKFYQPKSSIHF